MSILRTALEKARELNARAREESSRLPATLRHNAMMREEAESLAIAQCFGVLESLERRLAAGTMNTFQVISEFPDTYGIEKHLIVIYDENGRIVSMTEPTGDGPKVESELRDQGYRELLKVYVGPAEFRRLADLGRGMEEARRIHGGG